MSDITRDISDDDVGELLARARLDAPVPHGWDQVLERHDDHVRRRAGRRREWTMAVAAVVVAVGCLGLVVALQARSDNGGDDPAAVDQRGNLGPAPSPDPLADLSDDEWAVPTEFPPGHAIIVAVPPPFDGVNGGALVVGGDEVAEVSIVTRAANDRTDSETPSTPATGPTDVDAGADDTVEVNGIRWELQSLEDPDGITLGYVLERDVNDRVVSLTSSGPLDVLVELAGGLRAVPDAELDVPRLDPRGDEYTTVAALDGNQLLADGVNGVYCLELETVDGASSRSCRFRTDPNTPVSIALGSAGPGGSFSAGVAEPDVARIEFTTATGDTVVVEPTDASGAFDNRFWITDQPGVGPGSAPENVVVTYDDGTTATLTSATGHGWTVTDQPAADSD